MQSEHLNVIEEARAVAAFDWGTSVGEGYHFARVSAMERLRAALAALRAEPASSDTERLDWAEKNADSLDRHGYGADDYWWTMLYNDGNSLESGTLREAIDAARGSASPAVEEIAGAQEKGGV